MIGILEANRIYNMDCRAGLKQLDSGCIDMVMTSPPYWSLRNYGAESILVWDENTCCVHEWGKKKERRINLQAGNPIFRRKWCEDAGGKSSGEFCKKCQAWRGQLGLEPSFSLYIDHLCSIFDEIRSVLKNSGTLWVNLGDTYNGSGGAGGFKNGKRKDHVQFGKTVKEESQSMPTNIRDYPKKCLCLIPFRFTVEMVKRGWILRNTIIWQKKNCMPASAKDRFTTDFEYLFFFSKSEKYYFEQQLEPYTGSMNRWGGGKLKAKGKSVWDAGTSQSMYRERDLRPNHNGRNKRCVWSINSHPSQDAAHFAVYPEELCQAPIKAGCPVNGIVLDPFMGSGTTAAAARKLNRNFIGFEVNPKYHKIAVSRLNKIPERLDRFI